MYQALDWAWRYRNGQPGQVSTSVWEFLATIEIIDFCRARWPRRNFPPAVMGAGMAEDWCLVSCRAWVRKVDPIPAHSLQLESWGRSPLELPSCHLLPEFLCLLGKEGNWLPWLVTQRP